MGVEDGGYQLSEDELKKAEGMIEPHSDDEYRTQEREDHQRGLEGRNIDANRHVGLDNLNPTERAAKLEQEGVKFVEVPVVLKVPESAFLDRGSVDLTVSNSVRAFNDMDSMAKKFMDEVASQRPDLIQASRDFNEYFTELSILEEGQGGYTKDSALQIEKRQKGEPLHSPGDFQRKELTPEETQRAKDLVAKIDALVKKYGQPVNVDWTLNLESAKRQFGVE